MKYYLTTAAFLLTTTLGSYEIYSAESADAVALLLAMNEKRQTQHVEKETKELTSKESNVIKEEKTEKPLLEKSQMDPKLFSILVGGN